MYHPVADSGYVSWFAWENIDDRLVKVVNEGPISDLVDYVRSLLPSFLDHRFIKREQAAAYNEERELAVSDEHDTEKALLQVDFSENYTCVSQDEIQSAHWQQKQVSLFTAAIWHSGTFRPCVIASDNLVHSKDTLLAYVDRLLDALPTAVKHVSVWSDGPSSQFKNRFVAATIEQLERRHEMKIVWNYFTTSHGKGPVDGIGGSVKRYVWSRVRNRKQCVRR